MHIAFAHLDLGIGGAEQLVVNAALALVSKGHQVTLFTTHHSEDHCFAQTKGKGALASHVVVVGDWLPRSIFGKCISLCSSIRMLYLALYVVLRPWFIEDVVFIDGVSTSIPILRLRLPVLFYCHFPDLLLCTDRGSVMKRIYRAPLDFVENITTGLAHVVVVNSVFTRGVFKQTFPYLKEPGVLYPVADFDSFTPPDWKLKQNQSGPFVSLNRFERKKNIELAINAFSILKKIVDKDNKDNDRARDNMCLIIAGGYDPSVTENVEYLKELKLLVNQLGLGETVQFKPSVSDEVRNSLLQSATCVIYTPANEHFGIVPIEAMYAGAPVLAVSSGGPLETVVHDHTGYLCPNTPQQFAEALHKFVLDGHLSYQMGRAAHDHVKKRFGPEAFAVELDTVANATLQKAKVFQKVWLLASVIVLLLAYFLSLVE